MPYSASADEVGEVLLSKPYATELRESVQAVGGGALDLELQDIDAAINQLREPGFSGHALQELRNDYGRLFGGPGPLLAPPFESVYRDENRQLMGPTTADVMREYHTWGLALASKTREPPDALSIELQFMALLAAEETHRSTGRPGRLDEVLAAELRFAREHLASWLPRFVDTVSGGAEHPFYPAVTRLLRRFVELDVARLEALRGNLRVLRGD